MLSRIAIFWTIDSILNFEILMPPQNFYLKTSKLRSVLMVSIRGLLLMASTAKKAPSVDAAAGNASVEVTFT
jgi:hypothetical protein